MVTMPVTMKLRKRLPRESSCGLDKLGSAHRYVFIGSQSDLSHPSVALRYQKEA